jgi:hypothetical protein
MHLVHVNVAKSVWLFPTEGLNPRGLDSRALLTTVKDRYAFQKAPSSPEDITQASGGLEFLGGSFDYQDQKIILTALKIFSDGIIAETKHTTDASDAVIDDALNLAVQGYGWMFNPSMIKRKAYYSELVVDGGFDISSVSNKLERISGMLSDQTPKNPFRVAGLRFGVDATIDGGANIPQFVIERRAGISFASDRYFSQAPMTTDKHLQFLTEVEKILTK